MPELPDVEAYIAALKPRIVGRTLERVRIGSISLLRTSEPALSSVEHHRVREIRRIGKRIAIGLDGDLWLVLHLMIAGRLHWRPPGAKLAGRYNLAAFDFPDGTLVLTEAGAKRRASPTPSCVGKKPCMRSIPAGSTFSMPISTRFERP